MCYSTPISFVVYFDPNAIVENVWMSVPFRFTPLMKRKIFFLKVCQKSRPSEGNCNQHVVLIRWIFNETSLALWCLGRTTRWETSLISLIFILIATWLSNFLKLRTKLIKSSANVGWKCFQNQINIWTDTISLKISWNEEFGGNSTVCFHSVQSF